MRPQPSPYPSGIHSVNAGLGLRGVLAFAVLVEGFELFILEELPINAGWAGGVGPEWAGGGQAGLGSVSRA